MSTKTWQEEFDKFTLDNKWAGEHYNQFKFLIISLRKHDKEELIKIVDKLKLDVETRIAFKNLKPESVGYNKCALKVQIKIKQIKQLIKDYYAK